MTTGERPQCNPGQEAPIVGAAEASISPFHAFIAAEAAPTIQDKHRAKLLDILVILYYVYVNVKL
jgi:hypothetical protein